MCYDAGRSDFSKSKLICDAINFEIVMPYMLLLQETSFSVQVKNRILFYVITV